jgi:hypothetical protein
MPLRATLAVDLVTDVSFTDCRVVIRILEEDYSFTDEHYGLVYHSQRKLRAPELPPLPTPPATRSTLLDSSIVPSPIPTLLPQLISPPTPPSSVLIDEVTSRFITLLGWSSSLVSVPRISPDSCSQSRRTGRYHIWRSYYWIF